MLISGCIFYPTCACVSRETWDELSSLSILVGSTNPYCSVARETYLPEACHIVANNHGPILSVLLVFTSLDCMRRHQGHLGWCKQTIWSRMEEQTAGGCDGDSNFWQHGLAEVVHFPTCSAYYALCIVCFTGHQAGGSVGSRPCLTGIFQRELVVSIIEIPG